MDPNKLIREEVEKTIRELGGNDTIPMVGVHILSEIMFCPRAGVLALESRTEDVGLDFVPAPALGGLPLHEVDKLTFALDLARQELMRTALFPGGAICAGGLAYLAEGLVLGMALGCGAAIFWPALRTRYADYCLLKHRLKLAEFARERSPIGTSRPSKRSIGGNSKRLALNRSRKSSHFLILNCGSPASLGAFYKKARFTFP